MQVGLQWTYEITLGDAEPLSYDEVSWPLGDQAFTYAVRGRFPAAASGGGGGPFSLVLRSKATAAQQGPLQYPKGVELEVVQDDLGVFSNAKQIFWAVITDERHMAHLVVTYDASDAPGSISMGWGDGYAVRLVFFDDRPGIQIGQGDEPRDNLLYDGPVTNVEGYGEQALLHFIRSVAGNEEEVSDSILGAPFTEEMWYAKNQGLVRLVQKVGGRTSMTWTLTSLTQE